MATTTGSPAAPSQPWGAGRQAGAFLRSVASVGHADAHRPTWANVGAYGWTWTRSRGGISARTRLGRAAAGTPAACAARWRRRKGRGWSASHHRRGLPRPPRYGSSAPQPRQWRGGARIARRAIVADAAAAPRTSALMCHPTGENPRKRAKPCRVRTVGRRGRGAGASPYGLPRPGRSMHPSSSCTSGTTPRSCRCRAAHRQPRAARRDRRSGRRRGGRDADSPGTRRGVRHRTTGAASSADTARG